MGNEKSESEKSGGAPKEIDTEKNHGKEETSNSIGETETEPAALDEEAEVGDEEEAIRGVLSSDYDDHEGDEIARTVYTRNEKYYLAIFASCLAFFSTISQPIYFPIIPVLGKYFNVNTEDINLTVTIYSVFQGLSPAIWCALADSIGRRPIYIVCFAIYIGSNIGLALATDYSMLLGLRILQAAGAASTVALGSGVVTDFTVQRERGQYIGIYSGVSLIGNTFGPVIGGLLSASLGWRSVFWFLCISAGVMIVIIIIAFPETNRFLALNGSLIPSNFINKSPYIYIRKRIKGVPNKTVRDIQPLQRHPLRLTACLRLFKFHDVDLVLIPASLTYTAWYMMLTAQSTLLTSEYGFTTTQTGLSFLASGGGCIIGSFGSGRAMGWYYKKCYSKYLQDRERTSESMRFNIPQARLGLAIYQAIGFVASCILFGWSIQYRVHYIVPILATSIAALESTFIVNLVTTLLVDLFPDDSASATAAVNLTRCLTCAVGLAVLDRMITSLGCGGAFTLMGGICVVSMVCIYIELKNGLKFIALRVKDYP